MNPNMELIGTLLFLVGFGRFRLLDAKQLKSLVRAEVPEASIRLRRGPGSIFTQEGPYTLLLWN